MTPEHPDSTVDGTPRIADNSRHERGMASESGQIVAPSTLDIASLPDHMDVWMQRYLAFAVTGVRSVSVATKIELHLFRFRQFFLEAYGHDRLSICLQRDVAGWQRHLVDQGLAPATVNNRNRSAGVLAGTCLSGVGRVPYSA